MAEQLKNSRVTPTCTLASASVTANVSTSFSVSSASGLPASGTFRLIFKGASTTGSDDAIAVVGAISGTSCSSVTWEEVGDQTTFTSGAELELDLTAAGLTAYVSDQISTHAALTTAHASATNLLHTTGAESAAGVKTFTDKIVAKGSALSGFTYTPGVSFDSAYPKAGIYHAAGDLVFFTDNAGTQVAALQVYSVSAQFNVPFSISAPVIELGTYWDGSGSPYTATNTNTTQPCLTVYTDLASAQVDIVLPDPFSNPGLEFRVIDLGNNAATHNIVLTCADDFSLGTTVEGASSYTINTNGDAMLLRAEFNGAFDNANWKIISRK